MGKGGTPDLVVPFFCDDDFKPILTSAANVFEATNAPKGLIPFYGSEKKAFEWFLQDSVRLIIVSRTCSDYEKQVLIQTRKIVPRNVLIGYDGLAIIVNKQNPDSLITVENLRKIFAGEISAWKQVNPQSRLGAILPVFNNPASGTVRYVKDSICNGGELSPTLRALQANEEVLDYVAQTKDALGIIGVGWVSNERDSLLLSFSEKVTVMSVSREKTATKYNSYQPFQYYFQTGDYPFVRPVYILHADAGYGTERAFAHFMAGDRGQLIVKNAGLLPTAPVRVSEKRIKVDEATN
jgi:phosphate transport system substrate-binding protein